MIPDEYAPRIQFTHTATTPSYGLRVAQAGRTKADRNPFVDIKDIGNQNAYLLGTHGVRHDPAQSLYRFDKEGLLATLAEIGQDSGLKEQERQNFLQFFSHCLTALYGVEAGEKPAPL